MIEPPHVLFVYDGLPPFRKGGAETRLGAISSGLAMRGWRVGWAGLGPADADQEFRVGGVTYHRIGNEPPIRARPRRGLLEALAYCWRLCRWKPTHDVDVVVLGQIPWIHFFVIRWRLPKRIPILVDCWEVWGRSWRESHGPLIGFIGSRIERMVLHKSNLVVAISDQTRRAILDCGVDSRRVMEAPNGVDLKLVDSLAGDRDDFVVVYFGRLVPHKNVDLLITAFREVAVAVPHARLSIIGDGGERPRLEALAGELGIAARVRFFGAVGDHSEALALLKRASICVQPSTSEGGGSVAVHEANACGLPVIAFRHPQGIDPALIAEGVNGFWLDRVAPEPLAQTMIALLRDHPRLRRLRQSSREAAAGLDWTRTVDAVDKGLRQLVAEASEGASELGSLAARLRPADG